jgi:hypothetical protein
MNFLSNHDPVEERKYAYFVQAENKISFSLLSSRKKVRFLAPLKDGKSQAPAHLRFSPQN